MLCAEIMQNGKEYTVNARYAVAAIGIPLRSNGVYPNKLKLRSRHVAWFAMIMDTNPVASGRCAGS